MVWSTDDSTNGRANLQCSTIAGGPTRSGCLQQRFCGSQEDLSMEPRSGDVVSRPRQPSLASEISFSSMSTSYGSPGISSEWECSSGTSSFCGGGSDVGEECPDSPALPVRARAGSDASDSPVTLAFHGVNALLRSVRQAEAEHESTQQRLDELQVAMSRLKVNYRERRMSHQVLQPSAAGVLASPLVPKRRRAIPALQAVIEQFTLGEECDGDNDVFEEEPHDQRTRAATLSAVVLGLEDEQVCSTNGTKESPRLLRRMSAPSCIHLDIISESFDECALPTTADEDVCADNYLGIEVEGKAAGASVRSPAKLRSSVSQTIPKKSSVDSVGSTVSGKEAVRGWLVKQEHTWC